MLDVMTCHANEVSSLMLRSLKLGLNNLQPPTTKRGSSSFGRAIAFQAIGGEFEPRLPL